MGSPLLAVINELAHQYCSPQAGVDQTLATLEEKLQDFATNQRAAWLEEYSDKLGITLTDCITMDAFLPNFGPEFACRYQGLRHDSGDPVEWGEKSQLNPTGSPSGSHLLNNLLILPFLLRIILVC